MSDELRYEKWLRESRKYVVELLDRYIDENRSLKAEINPLKEEIRRLKYVNDKLHKHLDKLEGYTDE